MNNNTTTPPTEKHPPEKILEIVKRDKPELARHLEYDRHWLWYTGPTLQDKPELRRYLGREGLGFRFRNGGHPMPSGNVGTWFYWYVIPPKWKSNGSGSRYQVRRNDGRIAPAPPKPQPPAPKPPQPKPQTKPAAARKPLTALDINALVLSVINSDQPKSEPKSEQINKNVSVWDMISK